MNDLEIAIYSPFQALGGLDAALRKKEEEKEKMKKKTFSEEKIRELDLKLQKVKKGELISLIYFSDGKIIHYNGKLLEKDIKNQCLVFFERNIFFDSIYNLNVLLDNR